MTNTTRTVTIRNVDIEDWETLLSAAKSFDITMGELMHGFADQFKMGERVGPKIVDFYKELSKDQRKIFLDFFNAIDSPTMSQSIECAFKEIDKLKPISYQKAKSFIKLKPDMKIEDFYKLRLYVKSKHFEKAKREIKRKNSSNGRIG